MTTDIRPLNSSFLSGSLCDDSRSLFDQWKKHLEFQYDFVKVSAFRMVTLTKQGIIQENDRYRDEMDRLEKEVSRLRKLHASGGRDIGHRAEIVWEDGLPGSLEGKQILSQMAVKVQYLPLTQMIIHFTALHRNCNGHYRWRPFQSIIISKPLR